MNTNNNNKDNGKQDKVVVNVNANRRGRRRNRRRRIYKYRPVKISKAGLIKSINNLGNPNQFLRRAGPARMNAYYNQNLYNYLYGLVNPERAVQNKLSIKFPAYYPMPTQTLHIQNDFTVKINENGTAFITWRPNFVTSQKIEESRIKNYIFKNFTINGLNDPEMVSGTSMNYSQLTINNDGELNGQDVTNVGNVFYSFRPIELNIKKYRLIGAKLVLRYNGRSDEESGSITYGQYNGNLAPVIYSNIQLVGNQSNKQVVKSGDYNINCIDKSDECAKFTNFDKIKELPFSNTETLRKNKKYSFYYFAMDNHAEEFQHVGSYGTIDKINDFYTMSNITLSGDPALRSTSGYISRFQPEQAAFIKIVETDTDQEINSSYDYEGLDKRSYYIEKPEITNPSYIIGLSNLEPNKNSIMISIYETYEVIMGDEVNMLGSMNSGNNGWKANSFTFPKDKYNNLKAKLMSSPASLADSTLTDYLKQSYNNVKKKTSKLFKGALQKARNAAGSFISNAAQRTIGFDPLPIFNNTFLENLD